MKNILDVVAAVIAWVAVAVVTVVLLVSIAVGVYYLTALALITGVFLVATALAKPGPPDRRVVLQARGTGR